ncbi:CRISPR-associated protein Cas6 [Streptomyces lonarensis]|uniref:CRISPR-associated protein Cas6 n=2 Tax=Streptomyces lonarensis TaxID=700599 RepID=A0A7X6I144_9ACTN|nr:CRISPR-associated protein Cas6 [Streptomyces lonarensis]
MTTSAQEIPWPSVLSPGRSLVYGLLARHAPQLGRRLHAEGHGVHRMAPFGHSAPYFPHAARSRGRYAAGGSGTIEFGSPLSELLEAVARGLAGREVLDWGGVALRVTGLAAVEPPSFASGLATFRTTTPVVMKSAGGERGGDQLPRQQWLLPGDPGWAAYLQGNLVRKAETLGLKPAIEVVSVGSVGPKRSFSVGSGKKPGATIEVTLRGEPDVLAAVWSWGLGQGNSAGFGWIAA